MTEPEFWMMMGRHNAQNVGERHVGVAQIIQEAYQMNEDRMRLLIEVGRLRGWGQFAEGDPPKAGVK